MSEYTGGLKKAGLLIGRGLLTAVAGIAGYGLYDYTTQTRQEYTLHSHSKMLLAKLKREVEATKLRVTECKGTQWIEKRLRPGVGLYLKGIVIRQKEPADGKRTYLVAEDIWLRYAVWDHSVALFKKAKVEQWSKARITRLKELASTLLSELDAAINSVFAAYRGSIVRTPSGEYQAYRRA